MRGFEVFRYMIGEVVDMLQVLPGGSSDRLNVFLSGWDKEIVHMLRSTIW